MPLSATEAVSPAIEHAKKQLFQPFRFWQWTRLALVGLFAGELGSGGGCNAPSNFKMPRSRSGSESFMDANVWHRVLGLWHEHAAALAAVITIAIVFGIVLMIVFMYINSRMRFVLFDSVIAKECHIRQYWARRRECAWRYFVWQLLFAFCSMALWVILLGIPLGIAWMAGWLRDPGEHVLPLVLGGIPLFFLIVAVSIVVLIIAVMTKDFVVPYMAIEDISAMEGWRRVWARVRGEKGSYAGYIGMKVVLAIAAGVIFAIISFIVLLVILIPLVLVGVFIGVAAKSALAWNATTITLAVVAGSICFALLLYLIALISVPVAVFFPAYSIHFLASRYPGLDAFLHPAPPAPEIPPPMAPPFLPPEPNPIG